MARKSNYNHAFASFIVAKRNKNHFKGVFFFHFLNGSLAGIVFPYIVSFLIHSTNILSFSLLGLAYGIVLWILTLVPIHKPITGFSPWNHPLGHLPALASLSHIMKVSKYVRT